MGTRILVGMVVALFVCLLLALWRVEVATAKAAGVQLELQNLLGKLESLDGQLKSADQRFSDLGSSISDLRGDLEENRLDLEKRLSALNGLTKQEGDSDEAWKCLDYDVPAGLDEWLRGQRAEGGDHLPGRAAAGDVPATVPDSRVGGWEFPQSGRPSGAPGEGPVRL